MNAILREMYLAKEGDRQAKKNRSSGKKYTHVSYWYKKQYHIPYPVLYGKLLSEPPPPYVAMAIKKAKCVGKRVFCQ